MGLESFFSIKVTDPVTNEVLPLNMDMSSHIIKEPREFLDTIYNTAYREWKNGKSPKDIQEWRKIRDSYFEHNGIVEQDDFNVSMWVNDRGEISSRYK